jgi:hypothetical protein
MAAASVVLLFIRSRRVDGFATWSNGVTLAIVCAVIGYFGCTWERDG